MSQNPGTQRSDQRSSEKTAGGGKRSAQTELSKDLLDRVAGGVTASDITISKPVDKASPKL